MTTPCGTCGSAKAHGTSSNQKVHTVSAQSACFYGNYHNVDHWKKLLERLEPVIQPTSTLRISRKLYPLMESLENLIKQAENMKLNDTGSGIDGDEYYERNFNAEIEFYNIFYKCFERIIPDLVPKN